MDAQFVDLLDSGCAELGITLSVRQKEQFFRYYELLVEWNQVMNLTAITEMPEVVEKHFLDSLLMVLALPEIQTASWNCIDVGTGAGFPGIPLKIVFPNLNLVLLDSLNKRVKFLNTVIEELGLTEIHAIHGRAEDFGRNKEYREQFDLCVSRAVANMATLLEYCVPFVKKGGLCMPYKSGKVEEEANAAKGSAEKLGAEIKEILVHRLPGTNVDRSFISVRKVGITQKKYPRKAGMPAKEPIR